MCCYLTIISETGFPHNAVMLEMNGRQIWLGYHPSPTGGRATGAVNWASREHLINHYVRFQIPCHKAQAILTKVVPSWKGAWYIFTVQDCVSFAADVAESCGLSVNSVNVTPYGLVASLAHANVHTHYDVTPYPWNSSSSSSGSSSSSASAPFPIPVNGGPGIPLPNFNPPM